VPAAGCVIGVMTLTPGTGFVSCFSGTDNSLRLPFPQVERGFNFFIHDSILSKPPTKRLQYDKGLNELSEDRYSDGIQLMNATG
jgi:hypothetical protein